MACSDADKAFVIAGDPVGNYKWRANYLQHLDEIRSFPFMLAAADARAALPKGARVTLLDWQPGQEHAAVAYKGQPKQVSRVNLAYVPRTATKVRQYRVKELPAARQSALKKLSEIARLQADLKRRQTDLPKYQSKPEAGRQLVGDAANTLMTTYGNFLKEQLNTLALYLLYEVRYNQFDGYIEKWVAAYNKSSKAKDKLDPNVVKSMMFRESTVGMSGRFMYAPPARLDQPCRHRPWMQATNLLQAVDSYADQMLVILQQLGSGKADPAYAAAGPERLPNWWNAYELEKVRTLVVPASIKTNPERQEYKFTWTSSPKGGDGLLAQATVAMCMWHSQNGLNVMGNPIQPLWNDYEFWVRVAVAWLFDKYERLPEKDRSWRNAVRAYNGSGDGTAVYADAVYSRVGGYGDVLVSAVDNPKQRPA